MNTKFFLSAALISLLFLLSACGGSSSSSSAESEGQGVSKTAFIRRADAACTRSNKKRERLFLSYGHEHHLGPTNQLNPARTEDMIVAVQLPEIRRVAKELGDMTAPAGDSSKVQAIAEALEEAVEEAEKKPLSVLNEKQTPFVKAREMATAYGFQICGQY